MCSNEYIFVFPLADQVFQGYVSRGWRVGDVTHTWRVGDVTHTMYACTKLNKRVACSVLKCQSMRY